MHSENDKREEKVKEPIEFRTEQEQATGPKRVKLDASECRTARLATLTRDVPFTDYSTDPPTQLIYEANFTAVSIEEKKKLMKRCTRYDRAGIPEIDWERFEELLMARTLGLSESDWAEFARTHPHGLQNKLMLAAHEVNGDLTLTKKQIEDLKNLGGQDQ